MLIDHGKLYRENLKKAELSLSEFMVMYWQQGYFDLTNIEAAICEYNGKRVVLFVSSPRSAGPQNLDLAPEQELLVYWADYGWLHSGEQFEAQGGWIWPGWKKQLKQRKVHSA